MVIRTKAVLRVVAVVGWVACAGVGNGWAQAPGAPAAAQDAAPKDLGVEGGQALVGRALFLRCFCGGSELTYDSLGHLNGTPKTVDWTLAAVNVEKVQRRGPDELELDGTRVAIRYNTDQHVFERHPQKEEHLKILVPVGLDGSGLQATFAAIFSVGIDPGLQRAMPAYWRHYFTPGLEWPADDLAGQTVVAASAHPSADLEYPVLEKKLEPDFTNEARTDKVHGNVVLRLIVGTDGLPRRIAVRQPLGYGLDARTIETAMRYRFKPGTQNGKPVAVEILVNQGFDVPQP